IGDGPIAASFSLSQNYPNPFNPETQIRYRLSESGSVSLIVYNSLGQTVRVLAEGHQGPGDYRVRWDGRDGAGRVVSSGVYYYRLAVESPDRKSNAGSTFFQTRKMLLLR
ncbi:MAG TPA: FlgD immunoglobulin-like domain containing protein, partial [Calditrichia bacterium]|nr:FlgD immunoglobulin-like domain containing protein [Calditrichia bacterium]